MFVLLALISAGRREPRAHRPDRDVPGGRPPPVARRLPPARPAPGQRRVRRARARVQRHVGAARGEDGGGRAQARRSWPRRSGAWATRSPPASTATAWSRWRCGRRWTRARPRWAGRFRWPTAPSRAARWARSRGDLKKAIEAAERDVFVVRADVGSELLGALEGDDRAGAHAARGVGARAGRARAVDRPAVARRRPGVPRRDLDRPPRHGRSRARRRTCSSTWRVRRSSRSRTRACTRRSSGRRSPTS